MLAARESHAGAETIDHEKGGTPPVSSTVALYAVLMLAAGSVVVVMLGGGSIVMVSEADCVGNVTDVAVTVAAASALTGFGAVYTTPVVVCELSAPGPFSAHVTPAAAVSFNTFAPIPSVCPCPIVTVPLGVSCTVPNFFGVPTHPPKRMVARIPAISAQINPERLPWIVMIPHASRGTRLPERQLKRAPAATTRESARSIT